MTQDPAVRKVLIGAATSVLSAFILGAAGLVFKVYDLEGQIASDRALHELAMTNLKQDLDRRFQAADKQRDEQREWLRRLSARIRGSQPLPEPAPLPEIR